MKVTVYIVSLIVSFSLLSEKLNAQLSTKGTDFWFSCGQNRTYEANTVNLQYRVVAEEPNTVVTFEYRESTTHNHTMNIAAPGVYNYEPNNARKQAIYPANNNNDKNGITNKSVHVTSTKPIYLYVLNQRDITTDATNILPVSSLGTDYYHISYEASGSWRDGYTLVATENGTDFWEDSVLIAANMSRGQVYYRWPNAKFRSQDQTGLHITSNKPVAFFVTNSGVFIPTYLHNGADILYQQFMPVNTWGRRFMVPVTHRGMVRTRVLASQANTTVNFVGGTVVEDNGGYSKSVLPAPPPYTLDAGEFIEIHTALVYDNGTFIEADKPVAVCSYIMGRDERNESEDLIGDNDKGDPSIVWIPPIEQAVKSILAAPFIPTGVSAIDYHRALIVTPTATKSSTTLKLNGTPVPLPGIWYDHPSGYSFYNYAFNGSSAASAWQYLFDNPSGLVLLCYGFGSYESYYYFAGAAARDLDLAFYYTNPGISDTIHHQDLEGMVFCDTVAHFSAVVQYAMSTAPGYLKWFIDNVEQTAVRDSLSWWTTSLSPGVHTVDLVALGLNGDVDTASST
ncbi:MAG: IgGFc-binding protein, partial [Prevotellaceae bacterium]|nr:IgGFc-binding protein [Prevotellaceae bacterium]